MVGQFFDTMIVASRDKERLLRPIKVLDTVISYLKKYLFTNEEVN